MGVYTNWFKPSFRCFLLFLRFPRHIPVLRVVFWPADGGILDHEDGRCDSLRRGCLGLKKGIEIMTDGK